MMNIEKISESDSNLKRLYLFTDPHGCQEPGGDLLGLR